MPSYLQFTNKQSRSLPASLHADDVRYPDALVAHFIEEHTQVGDVVLDPFAGFGTTLIVAEQMGRIGYGVEWDSDKVQYIQSQIVQKTHILRGDTRRLLTYGLPAFDLCMTSPPYTHRGDRHNALTNYAEAHSGYDQYLSEMQAIYRHVAQLGKADARVVIEVANIKHGSTDEFGVTTLAWDVARVVSEELTFEGETVVCWDRYGYGYEHSYCLQFRVE